MAPFPSILSISWQLASVGPAGGWGRARGLLTGEGGMCAGGKQGGVPSCGVRLLAGPFPLDLNQRHPWTGGSGGRRLW